MWKVEVIADSSGEWCGNGLRFASKEEAEKYALDLAWRWTAVRDWRVVQLAYTMERDCMVCEGTFLDNGENDICPKCQGNMKVVTPAKKAPAT